MLVRPGESRRERHGATNDGVRAQCTGLFPLQVHRPSAASAVALRQAANLRKSPLRHRRHVVGEISPGIETIGRDKTERLRQELVMTSVGTVHLIRRSQRQYRARGATFLADAGVQRSVH